MEEFRKHNLKVGIFTLISYSLLLLGVWCGTLHFWESVVLTLLISIIALMILTGSNYKELGIVTVFFMEVDRRTVYDWDYSYYKYHLFMGLRLHTSYHKISTLEEVKNRVLKNYKTDGYYDLITSVADLTYLIDKFMTENKVKDYNLEEREIPFKHKGEISSNIRNLKEMLNKIE